MTLIDADPDRCRYVRFHFRVVVRMQLVDSPPSNLGGEVLVHCGRRAEQFKLALLLVPRMLCVQRCRRRRNDLRERGCRRSERIMLLLHLAQQRLARRGERIEQLILGSFNLVLNQRGQG